MLDIKNSKISLEKLVLYATMSIMNEEQIPSIPPKRDRREYWKKYYQLHKSSRKHKSLYKKNREKILAYQKEYRKNNKAKIATYQSRYMAKNREKKVNYTKQWRKNNAEIYRDYNWLLKNNPPTE